MNHGEACCQAQSRAAGLCGSVGSDSVVGMANAYATLAAGDVYPEAVCIAQVYDGSGALIIDNSESAEERVLSEGVASVLADFMDRVLAGQPLKDFFAYEEPEYAEGYAVPAYHIGSWLQV